MSALSEVLLPEGPLVQCLNVAIASLVVFAIAVVLSRCPVWSLPVRHALLVAALAVGLMAPLVMPIFPSIWSIRGSETPDQLPPSVAVQPIDSTRRHEGPDTPLSTSIPVVETHSDSQATAMSPAFPRVFVVPDPVQPAPIPERPSVATPQWTSTIGTLLCGIWFVGIAVGLGRAILGLAKLRCWIQTVSAAESPLIAAAARWAAEAVGLRTKVVVHCSSLLPAPVTFGLLHPQIVVPVGIESNLSFDQLRAVIQHEMAHIARRDLWIGLLQQVTQILYWWNPLVHLANRQIADLREQICDDIAIRELPEPGAYAETLINIAERCSQCIPVPATIGIGSSPTSQLESRIRRIVSSPKARCICLSRRAAAGVSAAAILIAATVLFAQVKIESPAGRKTDDSLQKVPVKPADKPADKVQTNPSLHDLIQQMAAHERAYLPFQFKVMETFRMGDGLTRQQRARYPWADGRKHQRLMEYAQLAPRVWRRKETQLINDEALEGLPFEQLCDGERIISPSLQQSITGDGKETLEIHIEKNKDQISTYLMASPIYGVCCLSAYSAAELFSEAFQANEEGVELAWDKGDAKLMFVYGHPNMKQRFVLWLSRAHAWHPIRLQRYWGLEDKLFFDEWEATKLVQRGKQWRVVEGTHRYRDLDELKLPDPKIIYSVDFRVLEEKFGNDVNEQQFQYKIPEGAVIRDNQNLEAEPPPLTKIREITVTVVDVAGQPIPQASIRLPASFSRDWDLVTTDDQGVARSSKAPEGYVTIKITAPGFRPVTWVMGMGKLNELRATMVPPSPGIAVDQQGKPVADAEITNETIQFRTDGITAVPSRDWEGSDKAWSNNEGRFEIKSELTVRRLDVLVPYIAVGPNWDQMAIRFVPAREMGQQQKLVLQPACRVHGHCLLKGMTESVQVQNALETPSGEYIGSLSTRSELTAEGLRIDFEMRLPAGAYVLKIRKSSHHAGFEIPFTIPAGEKDLDLGTKEVSPTGAVALKGKPAPSLDVQWRAGQQSNWEELRGKIVVLDFWGTWCDPCIADMPMLMELHDQFRDQPVKWLSIHTPNLKSFEEFDEQTAKLRENAWNKRALPFTTVIDQPLDDQEYSGKTSQHYGVAEWPTLIVVDQKGNVVGPVHKKKLAATIAQLLDGTDK